MEVLTVALALDNMKFDPSSRTISLREFDDVCVAHRWHEFMIMPDSSLLDLPMLSPKPVVDLPPNKLMEKYNPFHKPPALPSLIRNVNYCNTFGCDLIGCACPELLPDDTKKELYKMWWKSLESGRSPLLTPRNETPLSKLRLARIIKIIHVMHDIYPMRLEFNSSGYQQSEDALLSHRRLGPKTALKQFTERVRDTILRARAE